MEPLSPRQRMMRQLRLDVAVERRTGAWSYFRDPSGTETRVLDLVSPDAPPYFEDDPGPTVANSRYAAFAAIELQSKVPSSHTTWRTLLAGLQCEFGDVIRSIQSHSDGVDIEFCLPVQARSRLLRLLALQQSLPWVLAAYLFHRHRVRASCCATAPTLRFCTTVPLSISQRTKIGLALADLCHHLRDEDVCGLTRMGPDSSNTANDDDSLVAPAGLQLSQRKCASRMPGETRVAWFFHLVDIEDLLVQEPSFHCVDVERIEQEFERFSRFAAPMALDHATFTLPRGDTVTLQPILLPVTSRAMKSWLDGRNFSKCRQLLDSSVELAHRLECEVISLGQFTSIVTRNGKSLARKLPAGVGLTTGNSYTVCLAIQVLERLWRSRGMDPQDEVLLIGGALGNIGRVCAELLAPRFGRTILLGSNRPGSRERLEQFQQGIPRATISTEPQDASQASVILAALNSVDRTIDITHLRRGAIICDISVPSAIDMRSVERRSDLTLVRGGIARLPAQIQLPIPGYPLPPGQIFGCMAEGILLGLEGIRDCFFTGTLTSVHVQRVAAYAARHGLELADAHCMQLFGRQKEPVPPGDGELISPQMPT